MINWGENYDVVPKSMGLSLTVAKSMVRHQKLVLDFNYNLLWKALILLCYNSTLLNNINFSLPDMQI